MKGAIFFSGKYGSTEQYSKWISETTGLPIFDIKDPSANPSKYDFLVLGSSVMFFKLTNRKWVNRNFPVIKTKPVILFTVSGAGPGPKLEEWIAGCLPQELISKMKHVGLRGRADHSKFSWGLRLIMWMGSMFNPDPEASRDERYGFDYMDKESIAPIVEMIRQMQETKSPQLVK